METKPSSVSHILKIEWLDEDDNTKNIATLSLDTKTLFNLHAHPLDNGITGKALLDALGAQGAVLSDTIDRDGRLCAAFRSFDAASGRLTYEGHYQQGVLQDPENGAAAEENFDAATGHAVRLRHCQQGQAQDSVTGEPALQKFDPESGWLTGAVHYDHDKAGAALSAPELVALAADKHLTPPLPKYLRNYSMPALNPVS